MRARFVILGAGPTGLGAAWRLHERGETDWLLLEATGRPGGLAGSVTDDAGYTWDLGGHVQFSHYDEFDRVMDSLLGPDEWLHHERESWVRIAGTFVPYPFQNNLRYLPRDAMWECVRGLVAASRAAGGEGGTGPPAADFAAWLLATFGEGVCRHFMFPYNFKVWACPPDAMSAGWIGERVSVVDPGRVIDNIIHARDDVSWGPNRRFRFPLRGGTGEIWRRCAARLPAGKIRYNSAATEIRTAQREVRFEARTRDATEPAAGTIGYDHLITTMPLDRLVAISDLAGEAEFARHASALVHSSTHVIGLGVRGAPPAELATKCWMYFPEDNCPFYRATIFSNYSPKNVPDISRGWSLMCEVSESARKPVDEGRVTEETIRGAVASGLVGAAADVTHTWRRRLPYGYPTPTPGRDPALGFLLPGFERLGVFSRGRFGAWKYEVSNQDHSFMQGVECVDRILDGSDEPTLTRPEQVNRPKT